MLVCPSCNIPLCRADYEDVTVHLCPDCRGALVEALRLGTIKRRRVRRWSAGERKSAASRALQSDQAETIRCPKCLGRMVKETVPLGEGALRVDRCDACRLFWFDAGELELVQMLYEKEQDGRTPEDWERLERAAVARMDLETEKGSAIPDTPWYSRRIGGVGGWGGRGAWLGAGLLSAALVSSLAASLAACEWHDLSGASEFQRRQAIKRTLVGLAVVGGMALVLYLLLVLGGVW